MERMSGIHSDTDQALESARVALEASVQSLAGLHGLIARIADPADPGSGCDEAERDAQWLIDESATLALCAEALDALERALPGVVVQDRADQSGR